MRLRDEEQRFNTGTNLCIGYEVSSEGEERGDMLKEVKEDERSG